MLEILPSSEIKLSGSDIYFNSRSAVPLSFIPSANVEKLPASQKIVATPETVKLLGKRTASSAVLSPSYGKPFSLGNYSVELIPSGQMLGAAQVVVEKGGRRVVYAGGFKTRQSATAASAEIRRCDTLIVDSAYGTRKLVFPQPEAVMQSVFKFVLATMAEGEVPVILANPMGKVQDLIIFLGEKKIEISLHPEMAKTLRLYEELGVRIPPCWGIQKKNFANRVLIAPLSYRKSAFVSGLERKKVAVVSGYSMENAAEVRSSFQADVAFPLSNHWGYDELSELLRVSKPENLIVRGNFGDDLTKELEKDGWNVTALKNPRQLALF